MLHHTFNTRKLATAFCICAAMLSVSCKKYLSPTSLSTFEPSITFGNVPNAKAALMGAYLSFAGDYGYGIRASYYYPYDDDNIMGGGAGLDQSRHQIAHYTLQAGNADIVNSFNQFYAGIEKANLCIYYIPKMEQYSSGSASDMADLRRMLGEAIPSGHSIILNWCATGAMYRPSGYLLLLYPIYFCPGQTGIPYISIC